MMKSNLDGEGVLERSLRRQVSVRQLDGSFDAAVWARIAAEESKAAAPVMRRPTIVSPAGRWISVVNVVGIASVVLVVCVFVVRWLAGIQVDGSIPEFTPLLSERDASLWSTGIAGAALLF